MQQKIYDRKTDLLNEEILLAEASAGNINKVK
jgi:hypothetical protein